MKYRRIISFALTGAVLLSTFGEGLPALAAPANGLVLTNLADGQTVASVIRGDTIKIKVDNKNNHVIKTGEQGLKVTDDKTNVVNKDDFDATMATPGLKTDIFNLLAKRPNATPPPATGDPFAFYRIYANYYASMDKAETTQTSAGASHNRLGTFVTGQTFPVGSVSTATLTYTTVGGFVLSYSKTDTPSADEISKAGIFNDWKQGAAKIQSETENGSPTVPYEAKLQFSTNDGKPIDVTFKPESFYYIDRKDAAGLPVIDPITGKPYQDKVYGIEDGTTFDITFNYGTTSYVGLSVHNQVDVLKGVVVQPTEYFKPTVVNDEPTYITGNVNLTGRVTIYGREINLSWWYLKKGANDVTDRKAITDGDRAQKVFKVSRSELDEEGELIVRATYVEPKFFDITDAAILKSVEGRIPIIIKGEGTETKMEKTSYITGQDGTKPYTDTSFPGTLTMDKYNGAVANYDAPKDPFSVLLKIIQGTGNGYPVNISVTSSDPEVVTPILKKDGKIVDGFAFNSIYVNEKSTAVISDLLLTLNANKAGTTQLEFKYMVAGNKGVVEDLRATKRVTITVKDTSPDETADLSDFTIKNNGEFIKFGFTPKTYTYPEIMLPYKTTEITFEPTAFTTSQKDMSIKVEQMNDNALWVAVDADKVWKAPSNKWEITPGGGQFGPSIFTKEASTIKFVDLIDRQLKITLTVRAQNPNITKTYTFLLRQKPASDDSTLKTLELFDEEGVDHMVPLVAGQNEYTVKIPYSVGWLKPNAVPNQEGATIYGYSPPLVAKGDGVIATIQNALGNGEWIETPVDSANINAIIKQEIKVEPENKREGDRRTYTLNIVHNKPSNDATISELTITDKLDVPITTLKPGFAATIEEYELNIPFATESLKILLKSGDKNAKIELLKPDVEVGKGIKMSQTIATSTGEIPPMTTNPETGDVPYKLTMRVVAEDGTVKSYILNVFRAPASTINSLSGVKIADKAGVEVIYDFDPEIFEYPIEVLYAIDQVTLTPTPTYEGVKKITVNGRTVPKGEASGLIKLDYPTATKVVVEVFPEDVNAPTGKYTYTFTRTPPSDDALLKELTVGGSGPLKPVWVPKNTNYTSVVDAEGKTVTVIATANNPYATITIDGKKAESGKASEPITLMSASQAVKIVVTAQDKKTIKTYVITFQNDNMVEKSNNADLRNLTINYGEMTPKFKPSTTIYEVSAGEETFSVDILPVPADRLAKIKVFAGTKEIGDARGNYSQAITDGENNFSVEVISPDGKVPKTYDIAVFRNEEDKMGTLKPISPDEIDYKASDVIVVDITKYTRISADVFNELKKYPTKKIIFEGNDYSLQFNAKDLTKVIPSTTIYDFAMSFDSPEEQDIYDLLDERKGNEYLRPVMIYFTHHGALPAPAQLNISLGRRYANRREYWNYYNAERNRIDYYGYVDTNSRGTFTVTLDHFSTYLATGDKIIGAENKSPGDKSGDQNLSQAGSGNKINPGTGVSGGGQ